MRSPERTPDMLTQRDLRILTTLTTQLKLLAADQVADFFFGGCRQSAHRRLEELRKAGFVVCANLPVEPLPPITEPLANWKPGQELPEIAPVITVARSRWTQAASFLRVVQATRKAALITGGKVRAARLSELSHDRALAKVWQTKGCPEDWRGEAIFPRRKGCVPDALCGSPAVAVDFIGKSYTLDDVEALAADLGNREISFELW